MMKKVTLVDPNFHLKTCEFLFCLVQRYTNNRSTRLVLCSVTTHRTQKPGPLRPGSHCYLSLWVQVLYILIIASAWLISCLKIYLISHIVLNKSIDLCHVESCVKLGMPIISLILYKILLEVRISMN